MRIFYRTWIDLTLFLTLMLAIGLGLGLGTWVARNNVARDSAATDLLHAALQLNMMAYENQQWNISWPREQWRERLEVVQQCLTAPAFKKSLDPSLVDALNTDYHALLQLLTPAIQAQAPGPDNTRIPQTLTKLTHQLTLDALQGVEATRKRADIAANNLNIWMLGLLLALGICAALLSRFFRGRIVGALDELRAATEAVNPASAEIPIRPYGPPEVAELGRAVSAMAGRLREALQQAHGRIEALSAAAAGHERRIDELARERASFETLMQNAPMGIVILKDPDLGIKWCNRAYRDILDPAWRDTDLTGTFVSEVIPEPDREGILAMLRGVAESGRPATVNEHMMTGTARGDGWWRAVTLALPDPARDQPDLAVFFIEITDHVRTRRQLQEFADQLDRINTTKDKFLATLGHELRNPLAPIQNSLYVLHERGLVGSGPQQQFIAIIERQVRLMTRLVDDLLDISRISRGKIDLRKDWIDLNDIVQRAIESTGPVFANRRLKLNLDLPARPLILEADPARLEQILVNLLNNAAKYTEPGGQVWVRAGTEAGECVIQVRDTGIGVPADMLASIFEPFSQVERAIDRSQGGLGLGLALVRSLAELHGGRVEIHSPGPGQGSEFTVHLPAPAQAHPVTPHPHGEERGLPENQGLRILIVEDSPDTASSTGHLLEMWGHSAVTVPDGYTALAQALQVQPDAILLDIGLPGINGYEVARRLREIVGLTAIPIIAISGYGQTEDRNRSREVGINHHFTKPINLAELQELLAGYARGRTLGRPGEAA